MDPSVVSPETADQVSQMSLYVSIMTGLSLSVATGFRVLVPWCALSIAANSGVIHLPEGLAWVGSWPAMIMFATAAIVECAGYFIPWVDNILDTITTPGALLSGTVLAASVLPEMPMHLEWAIAVIGGGGSAEVIQIGTSAARVGSTATTGGVANPVVSTGELMVSGALSVLAFVIPLIVGTLAILLPVSVIVWWMKRRGKKQRKRHSEGNIPDTQPET